MEKATNVNTPKHSPGTTREDTGLVATLLAMVSLHGGEAGRTTRRRLVLVCLAGIVGLGTLALELVPSVAAETAGKPEILGFGPHEPSSSYVHATRVLLNGQILPFGSDTHWEVRYSGGALSSCKEGTLGGSGIVEFPSGKGSQFTVELHHLTPETTYHAVLCAENASGPATATTEFTTTPVGPPEIVGLTFLQNRQENIHTTSATFEATVETDGLATEYHIEYAKSLEALDKKEGTLVAGASGSVGVEEDFVKVEPHLEGLEPATEYFLRVVASNAQGGATETFPFTTKFVHPGANLNADAITNITGSSVDVGEVAGASVYPGTFETSWWFETGPSEAGPWTRVSGAEGTIPQAQADEAFHPVSAKITGLTPATEYYVRLNAENSKGPATGQTFPAGGPLLVVGFETSGPPRAETFAVHGVHGDALRLFASVRQAGIDTHYHFQYVTQEDFETGGWAKAENGPEEHAGPGTTHEEFRGSKAELVVFDSQIVAGDVPGLRAGVTYHFRVVASNAQGSVTGGEQTLSVPVVRVVSPEACPNSQFRTGLSLHLADCRAYEQVTPVNKEGTQELFKYSGTMNGTALVGENGEAVEHRAALTHYGSGGGPYFFSRAGGGWQLTAGAPAGEAGVNIYNPEAFDPNLTRFAFKSQLGTLGVAGATVQFRAGPPGGPYATVATVPTNRDQPGWVASSEDFSHLFLQVEDHTLLGSSTGTTSGSDLYEYFEGALRQVNVNGEGHKVGSCGATIAGLGNGVGEKDGHRHAVSGDGSRVFFEAVPGAGCSEASHLFMRLGGTQTRDLGAYRFLAGNAPGTMLVLSGPAGIVLYDVETAAVTTIVPAGAATGLTPTVSAGFATIYFTSHDQLTAEAPVPPDSEIVDLYRYDIASAQLRYLVQIKHSETGQEPSADGRYDYFRAVGVTGLPAGVEHCKETLCGQLFRYDSAASSLECVSCASPFAPEPGLGIENEDNAKISGQTSDGMPAQAYASGDGKYAFFATPAKLVPQDQNGEVPDERASCAEGCPEHFGGSPSTDVYEWRAPGVGECALLQGCLSLITPGTDGFLVALLGIGHEGRDVFFTTHSSLLAQDSDTAGDIYDARIGGGFAAAVVPVECEGDACSTPASAPNDPTPTLLPFTGAGNPLAPAPVGKPKPRGGPRKCFKHGKHHKRVRVKCPKSKPKSRNGKKARSGPRRGGV
jgi:hypothetical protein